MKKSLPILVILLAGAVSTYAQGQIEFDDYAPHVPGDGFEITIWAPQAANPNAQVFGNGAADVPAGSQTYTGVAIGGGNTGSGPTGYSNGNNYSIELLYAAGASQPLSSLTPVPGAVATFDASGGATAANGFPGSWDASGGVFATVPTVAYGSTGTFALAAWYNGGGTLTLAQASVSGSGNPYGYSNPANILLAGPPAVPSTLNPITSFSLLANSTPEPSTIALGVIGASAFLMRLRRK